MRYLRFWVISFGLIVDLASGQVISTSPTPTSTPIPSSSEARPKNRPILMGPGANSLINLLDGKAIGEQSADGQEVMFYCIVNKNGKVISSATYRASPGSDPLEKELNKRLNNAIFVPAIHDYKAVDAVYYGTARFSVFNGRPRVRIFSNQQFEEVAAESDFISPQPYFGGDSKFLGLHYPKKANGKVNGMAELSLHVDQDGNLKEMNVAYENPAESGFGDAAIIDFTGAKFIPAFRDGEPVECTIKLPVFYQARPL